VRIAIFGGLVVAVEGRTYGPRDFSGLKPKQVLEILTVEREHTVSKTRLAQFLWGDAMPRNYLATLESYVSVLRQTLQPGVRAKESVILTEHGGYRLDTERVAVDLDEFDASISSAAGAAPHIALSRLNDALRLARGPVLEDEMYAEWTTDIRSAYEQRLVQTLIDAGRLSLLTGDSVAAVNLAEKAVTLNALAEPAYQVLMTAYYATWRQDDALAAYSRCQRLLGEELGVDPLNETVALHLAILRHEDVAVLLPGAHAQERGSAKRPDAGQLPLLGRSRELTRLTTTAESALAGKFSILLVTGEPGIGKTRLIEAVSAQLSAPVASNRCSDLESGLPYLAISLTLRTVLGSGGDGDMPVLDDLLRRAEAAQPFDEFARMRVMEQLARLIDTVGQLVLVLDDVQWADPETIAVLKYLRRRCPTAPVAVLLACDRTGLQQDGLRNLSPDLRVDLGALREEDVAELGESIYSVTGGHPLFLADWVEAREQGLQDTFSPHVRDRVVTQCWDLGPQAYRLATVATVLTQPFAAGPLATLVDARVDDIADELDRLITQGLLKAAADGFSFRHPAVREILLETLSPARRFLLQQKAAATEASPRRRATDRLRWAPDEADSRTSPRMSFYPSLSHP
jgi:DNA-binding SARP family transcriptional activator